MERLQENARLAPPPRTESPAFPSVLLPAGSARGSRPAPWSPAACAASYPVFGGDNLRPGSTGFQRSICFWGLGILHASPRSRLAVLRLPDPQIFLVVSDRLVLCIRCLLLRVHSQHQRTDALDCALGWRDITVAFGWESLP